MTILLADLLADLREDHRNMATMLDLLERDLERIRHSENPDYELIHDIMRYMTVYSDAAHHPKEDLLYAAMKVEDPSLAAGLEKVEPEHRELAILGETLRNDVEAIASGATVTRFRLVADMSDYVQRLREHMSWEEGDLFRRADGLVAAESAMFVTISHLDKLDPVFGAEREHSFANLLQNIKDLAES
ncbi:MAG: hemerythrin domain-containing protein [Woeseiaceae bacterium]|nr:hemerythrin domain-containing protein [Woeseiaceae bacterium]MDX2608022.1 hemerythrin domain-containing protein [Woeseiaceae bacterium]